MTIKTYKVKLAGCAPTLGMSNDFLKVRTAQELKAGQRITVSDGTAVAAFAPKEGAVLNVICLDGWPKCHPECEEWLHEMSQQHSGRPYDPYWKDCIRELAEFEVIVEGV